MIFMETWFKLQIILLLKKENSMENYTPTKARQNFYQILKDINQQKKTSYSNSR